MAHVGHAPKATSAPIDLMDTVPSSSSVWTGRCVARPSAHPRGQHAQSAESPSTTAGPLNAHHHRHHSCGDWTWFDTLRTRRRPADPSSSQLTAQFNLKELVTVDLSPHFTQSINAMMTIPRFFVASRLVVIYCLLLSTAATAELCISESKTYTAVVDLFAGELGYFTFKECPGMFNPTIGMELGETYTFDQIDRSNWYHPLGFAYYPDGAHDGKDELERTVVPPESNSQCLASFSCPAPMYQKNGVFLGESNNDTTDFGLDAYEPEFFFKLVDWTAQGNYTIELQFDSDANYTQDIFYFCHIHQFMTGRIKFLRNGTTIQEVDEPPLGYEYDSISEFDKSCGTFGLDPFQLPNNQCPEKFVCIDKDTATPEFRTFASCIDAMNCHMMAGMTTGVSANSPTALFLHQMIPHHQNAVNMAKTLLHSGDVTCDDLTDEEDSQCVTENVLRDIVNSQNYQIQQMLSILKSLSYNTTDDCSVLVSTEREIEVAAPASSPTQSNPTGSAVGATTVWAATAAAAFATTALWL